jgi:hypothetical protein
MPAILLLLFAVATPGRVMAQGWFATSIASGVVGSVLLGKADEILTQRIDQVFDRGNETGNALLGRAASEARLLLATLNSNFTEQREQAVRDMSREAREAYRRLGDLMDNLEAIAAQAYEVRSATIVDIQNILGNLPFVGDVTSIVAVRGLTIQRTDPEVNLSITGTGLGPASDQVTSRLSFRLAGIPINPSRESRSNNNTSVVSFPIDQFQGRFDAQDFEIRTVPLEITLSADRRAGGLWGLFGGTETTDITAKVWLSFFPSRAGYVIAVSRHERYRWVDEPTPVVSESYDSRDCGQGRCRYSWSTVPVKVKGGNTVNPMPNDRRITTVTCTCAPLWGPNSCGGWHTRTPEITEEGQSGVCKGDHWGERNRYSAIATVQVYAQDGVSQQRAREENLNYGQPLRVALPARLTTYQVEFRSITGLRETITPGGTSRFLNVREVKEGANSTLEITAKPLARE